MNRNPKNLTAAQRKLLIALTAPEVEVIPSGYRVRSWYYGTDADPDEWRRVSFDTVDALAEAGLVDFAGKAWDGSAEINDAGREYAAALLKTP